MYRLSKQHPILTEPRVEDDDNGHGHHCTKDTKNDEDFLSSYPLFYNTRWAACHNI